MLIVHKPFFLLWLFQIQEGRWSTSNNSKLYKTGIRIGKINRQESKDKSQEVKRVFNTYRDLPELPVRRASCQPVVTKQTHIFHEFDLIQVNETKVMVISAMGLLKLLPYSTVPSTSIRNTGNEQHLQNAITKSPRRFVRSEF